MPYEIAIAMLLTMVSQAHAKACPLAIEANDQMKYDLGELKVAAGCTQVKLPLQDAGKYAADAMDHNRVLARTTDFDPAAKAGMKADWCRTSSPQGMRG